MDGGDTPQRKQIENMRTTKTLAALAAAEKAREEAENGGANGGADGEGGKPQP